MSADESATRSSKPLMEKRRRARINNSLLQLKTLVLDALNKNNPRYSKLEKADILEMTVRYLRSIHRQQLMGVAANRHPRKVTQYRTGYAQCLNDVTSYIGGTIREPHKNSSPKHPTSNPVISPTNCDFSETDAKIRTQLLGHLVTRYHANNGHQEGDGLPLAGIDTERCMQLCDNRQTLQGSSRSQSLRSAEGQTMRAMSTPTNHLSQREMDMAPNAFAGGESSDRDGYSQGLQPPPMNGGGITLMMPPNLVQSGHFPTHLIPVYATGPPMGSPTPLQAPAALAGDTPTSTTPATFASESTHRGEQATTSGCTPSRSPRVKSSSKMSRKSSKMSKSESTSSNKAPGSPLFHSDSQHHDRLCTTSSPPQSTPFNNSPTSSPRGPSKSVVHLSPYAPLISKQLEQRHEHQQPMEQQHQQQHFRYQPFPATAYTGVAIALPFPTHVAEKPSTQDPDAHILPHQLSVPLKGSASSPGYSGHPSASSDHPSTSTRMLRTPSPEGEGASSPRAAFDADEDIPRVEDEDVDLHVSQDPMWRPW